MTFDLRAHGVLLLRFGRIIEEAVPKRRRELVSLAQAVALVTVCAVAFTSCAAAPFNPRGLARDAANLSRAEAEAFTLEQQFSQLGDRYAHIQTLLFETQLRVAEPDERWQWISAGMMPSSGIHGPNPLTGATAENSYFLDLRRSIQLPGVTGAQADLEPVLTFFRERNWSAEVRAIPGASWRVTAEVGDGFQIDYTVQANGQRNIAVLGGVYWGSTRELLRAVGERVHESQPSPSYSRPGDFTPFPEWGSGES